MSLSHTVPSSCPDAHDALVVTITPTGAQAYGQCPLHFAEVFSKQAPHLANRAIERGKFLHSLIERYNRVLIENNGFPMSVEEVIVRVPVPRAFRNGGEEERTALTYAHEQLYGYREWLKEQEFSAILAAEQYVRTPARRVTGVEGAAVVFSGRLDLVALDRANRLVLADVKATSILAPDALQTAANSFVYQHLGAWAYRNDDIDLIQVVPSTGHMARAHLTPSDIEAGAALCRSMVAAVAAKVYPPRPGEYCAYCAHAPACPAFTGQGRLAASAF